MIDCAAPDYSLRPGRRSSGFVYKRAPQQGGRQVEVSIVTPFYNTGGIFLETVESVLAQSFQDWEWVIVDDGSTEQYSVELLAELERADPRIFVIRQSNSGPSAARNLSFANSNGRYICLLDSDDLIEATYIEKCVWFLESNPEFAFCNSLSVVFGDQEYLWSRGFETGKQHLRANSGPPISVIRRQSWIDAGGFDESITFGHEDWDFWLAMANAGHWGYTVAEYLQWYRKRGNGRFEQIMGSGNANARFERLIASRYAGLEKAFPTPSRRLLMPYESLPHSWAVHNPLVPADTGQRLLLVIPWMVVGGADRVNLDLVEGLIARGYEVTVCSTLTAEHRWAHKFVSLTPDVFVLPNFLCAADFPRFLAYLIESRRIDYCVISGSTIGYQLLPYLRSVAPNTIFLDLSHVEELHWQNGGHPRFGVGYQDLLDVNVVTTNHLAKWMEGRGADPGRVLCWYTGVRPPTRIRTSENRAHIRARFGISDEGTRLIVFAGRLCEQKRPFVLADVLKEVSDRGVVFLGLVIGDGELKAALVDRLEQWGLTDRVSVVGPLSHEEWLDVLVASDVLLMPSQYEGISIALLEAMAAGVVPVVADVGGQAEIVDHHIGYLIPHGDDEVDQYAAAVQSLLAPDGRQLGEMSEACRVRVATRYSWERSITEFEGVLSEAREQARHPRCRITEGLGIEMATQAIECKRLSDAVDYLWHRPSFSGGARQGDGIPKELLPAVRLVVLLCETRLGRLIRESPLVNRLGRWILARLEGDSHRVAK